MTVFDNPGNARRGSAPYINPVPPRAVDGTFSSGPVAFGWTGLRATQDRLRTISEEIDTKRQEAARRLSIDMLNFMRANAPWQDRTGQARATLMSTVVDSPQAHASVVYLGYGVFYGAFLENKTYGGKSYAIVRPTLEAFRSKIDSYVRDALT